MSPTERSGTMQRIGLFGGTFDPVHLGHLLVGQAAVEELALERLFFIPAAQSPFKQGQPHAPAAERLRLLRLALAGHTWCEVDEQEIRRGGVSYTVDTVRDYARRFPGATLFYLIGADHVANLPAWRQADELARLTEFVAVPRPVLAGADPATAALRGAPVFPPPFHGRVLQGFPFAVSSSQIRQRLRNGQSVDHLVPPPVAEALRNSRLYL